LRIARLDGQRYTEIMTDAKLTPKYSKEEFARRGQDIYAREVLPKLAPANTGKVVAIDIESGEFSLDVDGLRAAEALRARVPRAQIWCVRVGYPAVDRIG
jgi:hypothetical protein